MTFLACHQRPWLAFHPYEVIGEEVRNQQNRSSQTIKPSITLRHLPHPYYHHPASCTIITTTIAAKSAVQNTVQLEIRLTGHFLYYKLINISVINTSSWAKTSSIHITRPFAFADYFISFPLPTIVTMVRQLLTRPITAAGHLLWISPIHYVSHLIDILKMDWTWWFDKDSSV